MSCVLLCLLAAARAHAQQQLVDPGFKAAVTRPAYQADGPVVAIDEAHANFHTVDGQYKPFADLLRSDGYRVIAGVLPFDSASLAGVDVLVIANALPREQETGPAFTPREADYVRDWVRAGGSLLLIADHAPFGTAAAELAQRFGVGMGQGWAFDPANSGGSMTFLDFSRANGLLGEHGIVAGRDSAERITTIRTFAGQSLVAPPGATVLLKLSPSAREAPSREDLGTIAAAHRAADTATVVKLSTPVGGRAQGLAMTFGQGRVVVLGEAGMLSAQLVRFADGREVKFGMNVPGNDNRQFALNVLHWLSRL